MQDKAHILFVDDEANILQGLRRGLRSQRANWQMSFANSGPEALDIISGQEIDLIVSDMRMPGMDGAELLEKVCKISPDTARMVLSGYAQDETILKVVGPAHQYLAKPCDFDLLQNSIKRVLRLREAIDEKSIRAMVTGTKSLPSLPEHLQELIQEIENPASNNKTIAAIVENDLGLKSQVFKICNSAFFGLPQHIDKLETAVSLLGLNTLRSIAFLEGIFRTYESGMVSKSILQRLCSNSLEIAQVAQTIAQKSGLDSRVCDLVSSAATMSHIGSLLIATTWPDDFLRATRKVEEHGGTIDQYERELLGTDHAAIGAYFLGLWGFPVEVSEAVAFHHEPQKASGEAQPVLACLHIAQQMTKVFAQEKIDLNLLENGLDRDFLAQQNIDISLEEWSELISEKLKGGI